VGKMRPICHATNKCIIVVKKNSTKGADEDGMEDDDDEEEEEGGTLEGHIFLTKQPLCIKYGQLKPYQIKSLNWLIHLAEFILLQVAIVN